MVSWFLAGVVASAGLLVWYRSSPTIPQIALPARGTPRGIAEPEAKAPLDPRQRATEALAAKDADNRIAKLTEWLSLWAEGDGAEAVAWAESRLSPDELAKVLHDVLAVWIVHDTDGMLRWFLDSLDEHGVYRISVEFPSGREPLGGQVVAWLALLDPLRAARFLFHDLYGDGTRTFTWSGTYSRAGNDIAVALQTADEFRAVSEVFLPYLEKTGRYSSEARQILDQWREIDPDGAARYLADHPDGEEYISWTAAREMEDAKAEDAVVTADLLLAELGTEQVRFEQTMRNVIYSWPDNDLPRAARWVEEHGDGSSTYQARAALAARIVQGNPEAAFAILRPMPPGDELERVTENVVESGARASLEATLAFLASREGIWPPEKLVRLRELAVSAF